jgi:hypothetical protein
VVGEQEEGAVAWVVGEAENGSGEVVDVGTLGKAGIPNSAMGVNIIFH